MCGLTGIWTSTGPTADALERTVRAMTRSLELRGPDDEGTHVDAAAGFAMGHRRLAVIDLSADGHQPMASPDGRYSLAFNGEVYNFARLREELVREGVAFRSRTDTEVVLHALALWGVRRALERFVGMFALALWDARERRLVLARDRLGIKPLYFGTVRRDAWRGDSFFFGSELKPLAELGDARLEVERDALSIYLRHGYVPAPYSIWRGVRKLRPGTWLELDAHDGTPREHVYWDALAVAERGNADPLDGDPREIEDELERVLGTAIADRLVADVPVGAFLSGGIDSSLVVALAQRAATGPVKTFSIGFREDGFDESRYARRVAEHLGTDHTELILESREALELLPELPRVWDEPFADSSQIPTYLVSRLARRDVTVALSGDGGDELFGGYRRYFRAQRVWGKLRAVPRPVRRAAAGILRSIGPEAWDVILRPTGTLLSKRVGQPHPGETMHKLADVMGVHGERDFYRHMVSHWKTPDRLVSGAREPASILNRAGRALALGTFQERMMALDTVTYLPDDILCKVDRASMAHSLEARVPLLDHRVVELAWRIRHDQRVGPAPGKGILRSILARHVPRELVERPKMGFGVPIVSWLREGLRDWAEELLRPESLGRDGLLDPAPIRDLWQRHLAGRARGEHYLWDVLMFLSWREAWEQRGSTQAAEVAR